jgi:hypothetical protein
MDRRTPGTPEQTGGGTVKSLLPHLPRNWAGGKRL